MGLFYVTTAGLLGLVCAVFGGGERTVFFDWDRMKVLLARLVRISRASFYLLIRGSAAVHRGRGQTQPALDLHDVTGFLHPSSLLSEPRAAFIVRVEGRLRGHSSSDK